MGILRISVICILSDIDEHADVIKWYKWSETKDDNVIYEFKKMIWKCKMAFSVWRLDYGYSLP